MSNVRYKHSDCLGLLRTLEDKSVDAVIIDPPYYRVVNDKWDSQWATFEEYLDWCEEWLIELKRVAKYGASLWIFGFAKQLAYLLPIIEQNKWEFRQQIVIDKGLRAVAGRSSQKLKMFPTASEHLYYFNFDSKNEIRELFNDIKNAQGITRSNDANAMLNKSTSGGGAWSCIASYKKPHEFRVYPTEADWDNLSRYGDLPPYRDYVYKFKLPQGLTDVWNDINFYDRSEKKFHSTQKPIPLMKRVVKACTDEGDTVLDFFGGSGSTGVACKALGRNYIGCEIDEEYYELSKQRIKETSYETE